MEIHQIIEGLATALADAEAAILSGDSDARVEAVARMAFFSTQFTVAAIKAQQPPSMIHMAIAENINILKTLDDIISARIQ